MGKDGRRVAAVEVMLNTPHIRRAGQEGRRDGDQGGDHASGERGMQSFDVGAARRCSSRAASTLEEALLQRRLARQPRGQDQLRLSARAAQRVSARTRSCSLLAGRTMRALRSRERSCAARRGAGAAAGCCRAGRARELATDLRHPRGELRVACLARAAPGARACARSRPIWHSVASSSSEVSTSSRPVNGASRWARPAEASRRRRARPCSRSSQSIASILRRELLRVVIAVCRAGRP